MCVVLAARNESEKIGDVLSAVRCLPESERIHLLVVDDGSSDNTGCIAARYADQVVSRPWKGLGYSVREGYANALGAEGFRIIINMDADGQHDPAFLPLIVAKLQNGYEVVKCSRFCQESKVIGEVPLDRWRLNQHFAGVINQITDFSVTDALCGLWGFKREVLLQLLPHLRSDDYGLSLEILIALSARMKGIKFIELAHPAIYEKDSAKHRRKYSPEELAKRTERYKEHEKHVLQAIMVHIMDRPGYQL